MAIHVVGVVDAAAPQVGASDAWMPGGDAPNCCTSSSNRGAGAYCDLACAQSECAAAGMVWKPENYTVHPYECCEA